MYSAAHRSDLNAHQRALQRDGGAIPIHIGIGGFEALFGAFQSLLGALDVNFFRPFRSFGQDRDAVRQNFREAAQHRKNNRFGATRASDSSIHRCRVR